MPIDLSSANVKTCKHILTLWQALVQKWCIETYTQYYTSTFFLGTFHFRNTKGLDGATNIYEQACVLKQRQSDECILMEYC